MAMDASKHLTGFKECDHDVSLSHLPICTRSTESCETLGHVSIPRTPLNFQADGQEVCRACLEPHHLSSVAGGAIFLKVGVD